MAQPETAKVGGYKPPKEYKIKSREWPITAETASRILMEAKEIRNNKELHKAVIRHTKEKIKAMETVVS
jgi:hypothetical protein